MSELFTRAFWFDTIERVVVTAAQGVVLGLGLGEGLNAFAVDWELALGFALGGGFLAFLTAIISVRRRSPHAEARPPLDH